MAIPHTLQPPSQFSPAEIVFLHGSRAAPVRLAKCQKHHALAAASDVLDGLQCLDKRAEKTTAAAQNCSSSAEKMHALPHAYTPSGLAHNNLLNSPGRPRSCTASPLPLPCEGCPAPPLLAATMQRAQHYLAPGRWPAVCTCNLTGQPTSS
jgi:hypothetical protein